VMPWCCACCKARDNALTQTAGTPACPICIPHLHSPSACPFCSFTVTYARQHALSAYHVCMPLLHAPSAALPSQPPSSHAAIACNVCMPGLHAPSACPICMPHLHAPSAGQMSRPNCMPHLHAGTPACLCCRFMCTQARQHALLHAPSAGSRSPTPANTQQSPCWS
jgi:hypothetical protein